MSHGEWKRPGRCESSACVEIRDDDGAMSIRASGSPDHVLRFTREEWNVFVEGVKAGDFDV